MAAETLVDPWKSKYLAIKQLCEEHQMVRPNECTAIIIKFHCGVYLHRQINDQLASKIKDFSKVLTRMEMDKRCVCVCVCVLVYLTVWLSCTREVVCAVHRILLKKYKRHGGNPSHLPSASVPNQTAETTCSTAAGADSSHGREHPLHKVKGQPGGSVCVCVCVLYCCLLGQQ